MQSSGISVQPLSLTSFDSSPSRGASGVPPRFGFVVCDAAAVRRTNCTGLPRPPLLGEVSSDSETERLYEGQPDRKPECAEMQRGTAYASDEPTI